VDRADLRGSSLTQMVGYDLASWIGVDIRDINFAGAYEMRRFIIDQNYLKEFKDRSKWTNAVYHFWWATSDCGRSVLRWFLWTIVAALIFAGSHENLSVDWGDHPTWLSSFYYSVVILTTLGFGDVTPASTAAQVLAIIEVVIGYLMLGGLLSILSNKMVRRGE
jgi:hypothetical protein